MTTAYPVARNEALASSWRIAGSAFKILFRGRTDIISLDKLSWLECSKWLVLFDELPFIEILGSGKLTLIEPKLGLRPGSVKLRFQPQRVKC